MGQTLTHGIYLPDEGERNCYNGLAGNWQMLDGAVGTVAEHTSALSGKAPLVHTHTKSDITDLFNSANTWTGVNTYTGNTTIDKNSANPTTPDETALAFIAGSNYIFFRTKGSSNFKSYNSFLWGGHQGSGYSGEDRFGHLKIYRSSDIYGESGENTPDTSFSFIDIALHYKRVKITDNVSFKNDGTINACYPVYNNATDLGTPTNKWKSIYSDSYYYGTTAWGLDRNNTWTGSNTFNNPIYSASSFRANNSAYTSGTPSSNVFYSPLLFGGFVNGTWTTSLTINGAVRINGYNDFSIRVYSQTNNTLTGVMAETNANASDISFRPIENGTHNLGNSSYKWKSLNGVNPGALSLPDYSDPDPINFSQWSVPGNSNNYTPTEDGWLCIIMKDAATTSIFIYTSGIASGKQYAGSVYGNGTQGSGRLALMIPVRANVQYTVILRGDSVSDIYAVRFYPALGNV